MGLERRMTTNDQNVGSAWSGWIAFAAVMMFIIGCINMIQGLAALIKHTVYVLPNSGLLVSTSYTTWGWVLVFWGIIMATAAYGLFSGSELARWFAAILVAINLLGRPTETVLTGREVIRITPGRSAARPAAPR